MSRAGALLLIGLFGSLALTKQTSLAQNNSGKPPSFPPLQLPQFPALPPLPLRTHGDRVFLFLEPNCGPIGVRARMIGQLDSLPSRIVQLELKNTSSVAIISERITVHGIATKEGSSPALQQADARTLEIESNVTVAAGQEVSVDSLLTGFSDVKHIELNSVTYADGSSWQPVNGEACVVTAHAQ